MSTPKPKPTKPIKHGAPRKTRIRDTKGTAEANERKDLTYICTEIDGTWRKIRDVDEEAASAQYKARYGVRPVNVEKEKRVIDRSGPLTYRLNRVKELADLKKKLIKEGAK